MMVKAIIVEQLEQEGVLRSFTMEPTYSSKKMIVAFADEYEDGRTGPFHFLDKDHDKKFREGFAECATRRLGTRHFQKDGNKYHVDLNWSGIPTERQCLTYYAIVC